ncbi:unnamed protein product [Notodromas monacha]|uniref:Thioredoxin-like protein 1 n=1 Tax=Notodromas monacha TaxID=399045 RepID=A0A7R9BH80_9CRUS|nr:unnamed protein product [Notodromas monacha]CAG0913855.1 unnamed protein product [Notodromas monacha]
MAPLNVKDIQDLDEYRRQLESAGEKLVIADFGASWCRPCHLIAPVFQSLADKYPNAVFLKVDVDQCQDVPAVEKVSKMPTFIFYKESAKVDLLQGADPNALESMIKKHYSENEGAGDESLVPGQLDLTSYISKSESECLNDHDEHPWINALEASEDFCSTMIFNITFNTHVKLHSILLQAPEENGPKVIKLFTNLALPLDFDSALGSTPTQELTFTPEELVAGKPIQLKFVKFQNVNCLTIFVQNNVGEQEVTRINRLVLFGTPITTTHMDDFKRVAGKPGESH